MNTTYLILDSLKDLTTKGFYKTVNMLNQSIQAEDGYLNDTAEWYAGHYDQSPVYTIGYTLLSIIGTYTFTKLLLRCTSKKETPISSIIVEFYTDGRCIAQIKSGEDLNTIKKLPKHLLKTITNVSGSLIRDPNGDFDSKEKLISAFEQCVNLREGNIKFLDDNNTFAETVMIPSNDT